MTTMTLEELERRAYANGDTAVAALLARAVDGDDEMAERLQDTEDTLADTQRSLDDASERIAALEGAITGAVTALKEAVK